jgi:hypothetical protein
MEDKYEWQLYTSTSKIIPKFFIYINEYSS